MYLKTDNKEIKMPEEDHHCTEEPDVPSTSVMLRGNMFGEKQLCGNKTDYNYYYIGCNSLQWHCILNF